MKDTNRTPEHYRGLPRLLYTVRWSQHLLSIIAEVVILLSFAMSGMDVSLGGVMASVPILKVLWAGMFALGIDTAFVLSWVRVRQSAANRRWLAFTWNIVLALAMSAILFQPIAIQLLQQSLNVDFTHAVGSLGINIVILTYARSAVAVLLGAILAITNVESEMTEQPVIGPKRKVILFERLLNQVAPVVSEEIPSAQVEVSEETPYDIAEQPTVPLPIIPAQVPPPTEQPVVRIETTPQERAAQVSGLNFGGLSAAERVARVITLFPDISDRELGKLSGVSPATAKKYRPTH
jgi:hypothetical protein